MTNFSSVETALVEALIAGADIFTADNCKAKDQRAVYNYALSHNTVHFFAWTDFLGGNNLGRGIWQHIASLDVGILSHSSDVTQVDDDIRTVVDTLENLLLPDHRLGGDVTSAYILSIAEPVMVINEDNSIHHIRLSFRVALEETLRTGSRR
jgi:hypothetical protein